MPLDHPDFHPFSNTSAQRLRQTEVLKSRVYTLNTSLRYHSAADVIGAALHEAPNLALVSSFGAESVVLLHLASMVKRDLPVLFIDTEMLFTETLVYQQEVAERLQLTNVTLLRSGHSAGTDPDGTLHQRNPNACCALRKTQPLQAALHGFDGWLTGRKRFQSGARAALEHFECEARSDAPPRLKVNPLAYWSRDDVTAYMEENRLPRHPLVAQGYPSIGCAPCTSPITQGENPRAGRWRDTTKEECGIHFVDGKAIRQGTSS
ncbi:phosphoadenylyl-sulfate reductase [Sulfitobacter aestuariivivens]|uniref:Adenosine 5'-phosphosulfate reductase n=1 Tax=Sulfitobacter aestuariivivens TaxID=2766981 RepID=A0A927D0V0_9RHOB|nr:phosphoadenylyl-sulfate reductase [Sulfitobacter aestuariivivens]MBD3663003.1 phosphoadenylyl-sulfate reductase [Sulfitobacter aestuariivivens]